ncbi:MAG: protein translocase subunit SecD [Acidimicrobiia bacterium]|nr:protein translocase subunit SecD [Acidimicrobiia bacterium]
MKTYLVASILVVVASLGGVMASGDKPVLGLDLQGGISIVYQAVGKVKPGALDVTRDIIADRVNSLGVAEPEISRQGRTISVDLPGVKNRDQAARIVGQTGELRFRSVVTDVGPANAKVSTSTTTTTPSTTTPSTTTPSTTTTTAAAGNEAAKAAVASCDANAVVGLLSSGVRIPTTTRADDKRKACVVLEERLAPDATSDSPNRLYLGPTELTGNVVDNARSEFQPGQGWSVAIKFTNEGSAQWDALGEKYFQQRVAIVLDGVVQSAPEIQPGEAVFSPFGGTAIISGNFEQAEADELAKVVNYGALPVELEKLTTNDVSPTLGRDQLDAGITAGLVGLFLVALYMLIYYRLLGVVVVAGLLLSAAFTYALITFLGQTIGLALTLAGVTGLIVSIGITVDSYVVYFERLKDEVRTGKTVRSSVDRGFTRSFRTIVAADSVSLIGALALYFIAVGQVRGFAFFLGVSTLLDLAVAYFFMHPVVSLMARRPSLVRMRGLGIGAGLDAPEVTA